MDHPLKSLAATVMIVDPSKVRRSGIARIIRDLGFREVIQDESLARFVAQSSLQHIDWVITPLDSGKELNAFSVLKYQLLRNHDNPTLISVLVRQQEEKYIPWMFQLGAFSAHSFADDMTQLKSSFTRLLEVGKRSDWNNVLMASDSLRLYLKKLSDFTSLTALENALIGMHPDRTDLVVHLAEALMLHGKRPQALSVLSRVKTADHELSRKIESLTDSLHDPENDSQMFERYGMKQVVLIDPDDSEINQLESVMTSTGVAEVVKFQNGATAWEYLQGLDVAPGMIVTEWRLPEVSGIRLCQRIARKWPEAHILVYSSLLQSSDRMILRELGISDLIEKPKGLKALRQSLLAALLARSTPTSSRSVEARIRQLISAGRLFNAQSILTQAETSDKLPEGLLLALRAELLFAQNKFQAAAKAASESLQLTGDNINLLNLLGKIYLKLRDFFLAEKFLEKAAELSPHNVERVCLIAETKAERRDHDGAVEALNRAEQIDAENELIIESKAKIALIGGDSSTLTESMKHIGNSDSVIRFMNNRGVLLAKSEKYNECIKLYTTALKGLPVSMNTLKPVIAYNLGLALVKQGDLKRAVPFLSFAVVDKTSPVYQKANSLMARASDAVAKGITLRLNTVTDKETELDESIVTHTAGLPFASDLRPGEACLHLIFESCQPVDPDVTVMTAAGDEFFKKRR